MTRTGKKRLSEAEKKRTMNSIQIRRVNGCSVRSVREPFVSGLPAQLETLPRRWTGRAGRVRLALVTRETNTVGTGEYGPAV